MAPALAASPASEAALTLHLEEEHRSRGARVERLDVTQHGNGHQQVAVFAGQPPHPGTLGADDDRNRSGEVDRVVACPRVGIESDAPDARRTDEIECLREV